MFENLNDEDIKELTLEELQEPGVAEERQEKATDHAYASTKW